MTPDNLKEYMSRLRESICEAIDLHEAMTCIVYTDTDDRLRYECECGATSDDSDLNDREWIVAHLTDSVMDILSAEGIDIPVP